MLPDLKVGMKIRVCSKVSMSLSNQEDPRTGQDRRDGARRSEAVQGGAAPCAPHPLRTHPSRTVAPIPVPEPPVLVRKAQCTYRCVVLPDSRFEATR